MKRSAGMSAVAPAATALVGSIWLFVACAIGSPTSPAPVDSVGQPATLEPLPTRQETRTPLPSAAPTSTLALHPSPPPTAEPTQSSTATPATLPTASTMLNPGEPVGNLSIANGSPINGWQGSYCWHNKCADMPGLPDQDKLPLLHATVTDQLTFSIDPVAGVFYDWHAEYAGARGQPKPLASGDPFDPDANETDPPMREFVTFGSPPAGDWTLTVSIHFVEGGDAIYAWHVSVE